MGKGAPGYESKTALVGVTSVCSSQPGVVVREAILCGMFGRNLDHV